MFRPPLHIQGRDPGVFLLVLSAVCLLLCLYSTRLMRKRRKDPSRKPGPLVLLPILGIILLGAAALLALERL